MFHAHNDTLTRPGDNFQSIRQTVILRNKRMIAGCRKRVLDQIEQTIALVIDFGGFSMHNPLSADDFPSKSLTNTLMTQTYTQNRQLASILLHR